MYSEVKIIVLQNLMLNQMLHFETSKLTNKRNHYFSYTCKLCFTLIIYTFTCFSWKIMQKIGTVIIELREIFTFLPFVNAIFHIEDVKLYLLWFCFVALCFFKSYKKKKKKFFMYLSFYVDHNKTFHFLSTYLKTYLI